jgi:hypothetical protein
MEKPTRNLMDQPMMIRRAQTMMIGWEMRFRRVHERTIKERGKYLQTGTNFVQSLVLPDQTNMYHVCSQQVNSFAL